MSSLQLHSFWSTLKVALSVLLVIGLLTACNSDDNSNNEQAPIDSTKNTTTLVEEQSQCWQTEIIDTLYDLMGETALTNYKHLTGGALSLMMVAFAIWLSWRLMKQVSSFKEETLGQIWTEIARMFFWCFFCGLIASNTDMLKAVLDGVIFPIYNAFLEFASRLMAEAVPNVTINKLSIFGQEVSVGTQPTCIAQNLGHAVSSDTHFPEGPKVMMDCMFCAMSNNLSFGMNMAYSVMQGTNFLGWIVGLLVLLCFLFVKLGFAFYLVDTIFRFTLMVTILPLMIMGYPFKKTRGLLGQGIKNMVNSAGFMMFFALIIVICIQALSITMKTFENVFQGESAFKDFSIPLICILMIGFLVKSSLKIAGALCNKIVGGQSNPEFQKEAKALIMGTVKFVASLGFAVVGLVMPKPVKNVLKKVSDKLIDGFGKAMDAGEK